MWKLPTIFEDIIHRKKELFLIIFEEKKIKSLTRQQTLY